ncbi:MAG: hypothetical protein ACXVLQ_01140 [Bacteriovorax sp.]
MNKYIKNNDVSMVFIYFFLFFFICLLIYYPILNSEPMWDDWIFIFKSLTLKTVSPLEYWKLGAHRRSWPMFFTALSFMFKAWESDVFYYHFTSIFLHALNSFLVLKILKRIGGNNALLLSLLYLVHPLHFFTVSWIIQIKALMCIFFFLVSLDLFLTSEMTKSSVKYWFSVIFFGLALLSKAALAPMFLLMLFYKNKIKMVPYVGLCIYSIVLTSWTSHLSDYVKTVQLPASILSSAIAQEQMPWEKNLTPQVVKTRPMGPPQKKSQSPSDRIVLTLNNFAKYAAFVVYPWNNLLIHPMTVVSYSFDDLIGSILILFLMALLIFKYCEDKDFISLSGLIFFIVTILPLSGAIYVPIFRYSNFVEYWLSIPLLGLIVCAARLKNKTIATFIISLFVIFFGMKSFKMARLTPDPVSIISRSKKYSPTNSTINFVLAKHYSYKGYFSQSNKILEETKRYPSADKVEIKTEIDNNNRKMNSGRWLDEFTP